MKTVDKKMNILDKYSLSPEERIKAWQKARGMLKGKVKILERAAKKARKEWNRY